MCGVGRLLHLVLHDGPPIGKPQGGGRFSSPVDINSAREEADRQRRLAHQQNMVTGGVVDGKFGFKEVPLYSDAMVTKRGRGFQGR